MDEEFLLAEPMRCPHGREFFASADGQPVFVRECLECQPVTPQVTASAA